MQKCRVQKYPKSFWTLESEYEVSSETLEPCLEPEPEKPWEHSLPYVECHAVCQYFVPLVPCANLVVIGLLRERFNERRTNLGNVARTLCNDQIAGTTKLAQCVYQLMARRNIAHVRHLARILHTA